MLKKPLMPWQKYVLDVALEIDPDTGYPAYREVILTVPRQSGKTVLLLALMIHRALGWNTEQRILYTAQTRNDAKKKWQDEHVKLLERSNFSGLFRVSTNNGHEGIFWNNGSIHGLAATTEKSGHGETLDLGVLDEAFALPDNRMEQSFRPAMSTRQNAQLWVVSTAGTMKSVYLRSKVDKGRALVESDTRYGTAYFEWSAPEDADPGDPATWWACMPALGHTQQERIVRSEFESMDELEFRRAFLNQWADAMPTDSVIDPKIWAKLADRESRINVELALGVDVTPEMDRASIAVYGHREDGLGHVGILRTLELPDGMQTLVAELASLRDFHKPLAICLDPKGSVGALFTALEKVGIQVPKDKNRPKFGDLAVPTATEKGQACVQFFDAVRHLGLRHFNQPELNVAVHGAKTEPLGEMWKWSRKNSNVDISPLNAATLARWAFETRAHLVAKQEPQIWAVRR